MKRTLVSLVVLLSLVMSAACQPAATPTAAPKATSAATTAAATKAPAATSAATAAAATKAPAATSVAKTDFPTRPVTIIVPYPPGGMNDMYSRLIAPMLEKELGQPVVIENKVGAGGQVGWREGAKAKPDGYTISSINMPHMPAATLDKERKADFTTDDFIPFISQVLDPTTIAVKADAKWKSLKELIDDAKARPGQIRAGLVGYLNDDEIAYLQMAEAAGIEMRKVFFDGSGPAITALLGENVDVTFCTLGDNGPHAAAGKMRILAVLDEERAKLMPDVPTVKELGWPGVVQHSTRAYAVPKGTPPEVIAKLTSVFEKVMNSDDHNKRMAEAYNPVRILTGEQLAKFYADSVAIAKKWVDKVVR